MLEAGMSPIGSGSSSFEASPASRIPLPRRQARHRFRPTRTLVWQWRHTLVGVSGIPKESLKPSRYMRSMIVTPAPILPFQQRALPPGIEALRPHHRAPPQSWLPQPAAAADSVDAIDEANP